MPGGKRDQEQSPKIDPDVTAEESERESGEDSAENDEEVNESSGTEEATHRGEDGGQNGDSTLDPAEEIHRDLEKMLDTRIMAAENAGCIISKKMRCVKEHLNTHNLTRLKTAIDQLQTARKRVEETYKEAARHDEKKSSKDKAYAGRCHKKKTQLVLKTDTKIDKAQRLLDEKSVEMKENSPDNIKKMCSNLKPTTKSQTRSRSQI